MRRIASIEAIPLAAKLREPFRFGRVVRTASFNVLVRVEDDAGNVGYGEACPVPQLTSETQETIAARVARDAAPALVGRRYDRRGPLLAELRTALQGAPFTLAAVDTALLDLTGHACGASVAELLGGRFRDAVEVHGSVGWDEDPERMASVAAGQAAIARMLKLYVGPGVLAEDLERIAAVRACVGIEHPFLLDVNGMWSEAEALEAGARLGALGVTLVEQPVAAADPDGAARVARAYRNEHGIDVVADESVRSARDVLAVHRDGLAPTVNIGVSKLGGLTPALDAAIVAEAAGLDVLLGSVVELGVATTASLHLAAALPRLKHPAYLVGPLEYERQITLPPLQPVDGHVRVPDGPGLGIAIDEAAVAALDSRVEEDLPA